MSQTALETNYSVNDQRKVVVSNQEITTRRWKLDSLFKVLAGIIYGFFFGMLPATFLFNNSFESDYNPPVREICAIVGLLAIGMFVVFMIFWTFKGDIKKQHPWAYAFTHLFNAILLSVGILVTTIMYPDSDEWKRYMVLAISYGGWAIIMSIYLIIVLAVNKHQFPLSWSRTVFTVLSFVFAGLVEVFVFLAADANLHVQVKDQSILYEVLALVSFIIALVVFGFGLSFIKRFRDVLLGERTDYEIETIRDWESSRVFALIMGAALIITYAAALIIKWDNVKLGTASIVEIVIDAVLLLPYIIIVSKIKIDNIQNSRRGIIVSKTFKTIDNGLLLDVFGWIIVIKSALIQGIALNSDFNIEKTEQVLMLVITFASLLVLYAFNTIIQVNVPNLRNTAITIPTLSFAAILGVFVILFACYLQAQPDSISNYVFLFMPIIIVIGMSISLIIKICMIAKIFKVNWTKSQSPDKSHLIVEEINQESEFIQDKTKDVDVNQIEAQKQQVKDDSAKAQELKQTLSEGARG